MKLVFGVFDDLGPAMVARDELVDEASATETEQEAEHEAVSAAIHQHDVRPNDLPSAGTITWRSGIAGALLVGGVVALMLSLLARGAFEGMNGPSEVTAASSPVAILLLSLGAAMFGGVLAAIAGRAGNRARVRRLEEAVAEGKVLLTLSAPKRRIRSIIDTMARAGALRTGTI